jgi:hypothetical protein
MPKKTSGYKPGQTAPASGQYQETGPRGGTTGRPEITSPKGRPLPPTTSSGSTYEFVDGTKNKSGKLK